MSFVTNLLMWCSIVWIAPLMYFLLKNECKPKKNIIIGTTLPWEAQRDETVLALLEKFKKEMKLTCLMTLAAAVPCPFIPDFGVTLTVWLIWIDAVCVVFYIPYARCNKALRQLKAERGWRQEPPQAVTDLKAAAVEMRWISPWWFLPPFLLSLVPLFFDRSILWLWILDAALIPVFYLCYRYLYRSRSEVVGEDSGRTITLTRIRRYNWGKCWMIITWATGLYNVGFWLTLNHFWWNMAVILAYALTACIAVLRVEFRTRKLQEDLGNVQGYRVDEDDHWIWGLLYYNPNDARLMVNDRVGINVSCNLARRSGRIIMGVGLAILLACPLIGVWMIHLERIPVELEVTEAAVTASYGGSSWSAALEDVAEMKIVEELPRLSRTMGASLPNALTGQFDADGLGRVTCCLDPRTGPWLLVRTEDGQTFLFGAGDAGVLPEIAAK